jgi:hypothetical protein
MAYLTFYLEARNLHSSSLIDISSGGIMEMNMRLGERSSRLLHLFFMTLMAIVGTFGSMQALPSGGGWDITYYSDATFSQVVGERYVGCTSPPWNTGVQTAYYDSYSWQCDNNGVPSNPACTVTTCAQHIDENGNLWYSNCQTTSTSGSYCFWKMNGDGY